MVNLDKRMEKQASIRREEKCNRLASLFIRRGWIEGIGEGRWGIISGDETVQNALRKSFESREHISADEITARVNRIMAWREKEKNGS